jgi:hypothetical protein
MTVRTLRALLASLLVVTSSFLASDLRADPINWS